MRPSSDCCQMKSWLRFLPGRFFGEVLDYFGARNTVPATRWLASFQQDKLRNVSEFHLSENNVVDVVAAVRELDLGVTRSITEMDHQVDLTSSEFPLLVGALRKIARAVGQRIFFYSPRGQWQEASRYRIRACIPQFSKCGTVELAFVDSKEHLVHRFSVNLWQQKRNFIENLNSRTPIKRLRSLTNLHASLENKINRLREPIDVVYTWVNSADQVWQNAFREFRELDDNDFDRFDQCDELKYSIRSVELYAPWVRNIFILSNCQPPRWLRESKRVTWVFHHDIIPDTYLPLFNSHAIESFLHMIPGVSKHFLYFNDDFFLSGFVEPGDFFNTFGQSLCRLESGGTLPYFHQLRAEGAAEEWQCAALNSAQLLSESLGYRPTKVHTHSPYAISKDLYHELISKYPAEVHRTREARFRQETDLSITSFLYHHYALATHRAVESNEEVMVVRQTNFARFASQKVYTKVRFFCLNDGGGSARHPGYVHFKKSFVQKRYPFKSRAEL